MPPECTCPLRGGPIDKSAVLVLPERGMVVANGKFVIMPANEMLLLEKLVDMFPRVLSKEAALDWLYQLRPGDVPEIKIIDVYICKLRKKLAPLGIRIDTSWGRGYALATPFARSSPTRKPHNVLERDRLRGARRRPVHRGPRHPDHGAGAMSVRIITADVLAGLSELPDESVQCVVTSPPYWGLRDYGVPGQLGLEPTLGEHIDAMVAVFREVRRVLRKDGTLWLNYGDCYATSVNGRSAADTKLLSDDDRTFRDKPFSTVGPVYSNRRGILKPKDLCGVPWRLALALQDDGWWLRQDIIWSKPNPMPESIKDRCTKAHEYLFLLTKAERYHFDAEAIAEPVTLSTIERLSQPNLENQEGSHRAHAGGKTNGTMKAVAKRSGNKERKAASERGVPVDTNGKSAGAVAGSVPWEGTTRNKRSVWTVATQPFPEAHFATFPPELIEPCIKAGTSEKGCCSKCGAPWSRDVSKELVPTAKAAHTFVVDGRDAAADKTDQGANRQKDGHRPGWAYKTETTGFQPSCQCDAPAVPCTVLDPFGGSGTTGLVADRLGRPEYAAMAMRRIHGDCPMFVEVGQ